MKGNLEKLAHDLLPMGVASHLIAQMYTLPPARFAVKITRDHSIPALDAIELKTDIYSPKGKGPHPTLLMRTPYGRFGFGVVAQIYAERGFRTILQACRGTDGSGGLFDPLVNERADGLATLAWIKNQKWFDGRLGLTGPSYLGYAQWAICDALPEGAAMSAKSTASDFENLVFPGGAFSLQLWLSWMQTIHGLEHQLFGMTLRMITGDVERRTKTIALTLLLAHADIAAVGEKVPFWRDWLSAALDNPSFWAARSHRARLNKKTPPNCFVSGWYDIMIDQHLEDFQLLVAAGSTPHLTIGPWFHTDNDLQGECLRQTISWMSAHLLGNKNMLRKHPVRFFVSGENKWHDTMTFPPGASKKTTLFPAPDGLLQSTLPKKQSLNIYQYDPADPTPNVGGAIFAFLGAGPRDNRELEERDDVLTFTTVPLTKNLTLIGNTNVRLYVKSSLEFTDFFVRLCDVDQSAISINICDAILRLTPQNTVPDGNGVFPIELKLHACAHTFLKGHRIRLQVSSGAHPRFARNLGTSEPIGSATQMQVANQEIFHGGAYPSAIGLPTFNL